MRGYPAAGAGTRRLLRRPWRAGGGVPGGELLPGGIHGAGAVPGQHRQPSRRRWKLRMHGKLLFGGCGRGGARARVREGGDASAPLRARGPERPRGGSGWARHYPCLARGGWSLASPCPIRPPFPALPPR